MRRDEMRVEQESPVKYAKRESAREIRERTRKRKPVPAKYAKGRKKGEDRFFAREIRERTRKKGKTDYLPAKNSNDRGSEQNLIRGY